MPFCLIHSFFKNIVFFWWLFLFFSFACASQPPFLDDKKPTSIDFSRLPFYIKDPESYSMYLFDKNRVLKKKHTQVKCPKEFQTYLRKELLEEDHVYFSNNTNVFEEQALEENVPENTKKWIRLNKASDDCFIIRLLTQDKSSSEFFLDRVCKAKTEDLNSLSFSGGLVIFPQKKSPYSIVFTLGSAWKSLLDQYAIVPRWGLKLTAAKIFCDPHQVREIVTKYYRNPIPTTRKERSTKVDSIERFGIEIDQRGLVLYVPVL